MAINITDYPNVRQKITDLGCRYPSSFAFLPANFESASFIEEFKQVSEAASVKTLFRNSGIPFDDIVEKSQRPPYIHNNSFEWVAPTIFVSGAFLSQNPTYMTLALNVISTYLTDFFRGRSGQQNVKLEVVVEETEGAICKRVSYGGSVDGLKDLAAIVHEVVDE